jgi:hypothetical protein
MMMKQPSLIVATLSPQNIAMLGMGIFLPVRFLLNALHKVVRGRGGSTDAKNTQARCESEGTLSGVHCE